MINKGNINYLSLKFQIEDLEDDESTSASASGATSLTEGSLADGADATTRKLLRRKELLETRKATMDRQRERVQVCNLTR